MIFYAPNPAILTRGQCCRAMIAFEFQQLLLDAGRDSND
jgi:hypothetical protein